MRYLIKHLQAAYNKRLVNIEGFGPVRQSYIIVMMFFFNLIALRTAKTLWSFGSSECNRV